jgi:hypothetical protein
MGFRKEPCVGVDGFRHGNVRFHGLKGQNLFKNIGQNWRSPGLSAINFAVILKEIVICFD